MWYRSCTNNTKTLKDLLSRCRVSFHHNLHAFPTHLDDGGGAGWEKIGDVSGFAWIGGRADEFAIDGIDVDAVGW